MRRPLFIILPIYILGITFGTVFRGNFLPLYFASAITLITHVVLGNRNKLALIFLALAIFLTAAASYSGSVLLPLNHISRVIAAGERTVPCLVKGFAYGNPIKRGGKVISGFKVRAMQRGPANVNVEGDILIRVAGNAELPVGMLFSAKGKLVRVNDYRRRNLFNTAYRYLMSADYIYLENKKHPENGLWLYQFANNIKYGIKRIFNSRVSGLSAAVLEAMVLGDKADIPKCVYDAMVKTGTVHILPRLYTKMPSVAL